MRSKSFSLFGAALSAMGELLMLGAHGGGGDYGGPKRAAKDRPDKRMTAEQWRNRDAHEVKKYNELANDKLRLHLYDVEHSKAKQSPRSQLDKELDKLPWTHPALRNSRATLEREVKANQQTEVERKAFSNSVSEEELARDREREWSKAIAADAVRWNASKGTAPSTPATPTSSPPSDESTPPQSE